MTGTTDPAGHLLPLPGGDWNVWRLLGVRGAGFPAARVLRLAAPGAAAAADRLALARERAAARREDALAALRADLDALRESGQWDDLDRRRPLLRAISRLNKGRLPGPDTDRPEYAALAEAERQAADELASARAAFDADIERLSEALRETAADPLFQEAVIWQNRAAYTTGISRLARPGGDRRNSRRREHEALAAGYLQRYCVKNDSIGFFGPIGWGRFVTDGAPLAVRPEKELLASREVYFEQWCLDSLAQSLGTGPSVRRWLAPRRLPSVRLDGSVLHRPAGPVTLPEAQVATLGTVLDLCDGRRTAVEVAAEAARLLPGLNGGEQQMTGLLASMCESGLIAWDLELPLQPHPERALRRQLERIGDAELRESALARLDLLAQARAGVQGAAGKPAELERALEHLESTFTELTGKPPTRARGETYGARTLVYEDTRRAGTVELGAQLRAELGPPLSLMLDSARWLTHTVAAGYRDVFDRLHRELAAGGTEVRFTAFWQAVQPLLLGQVQRPIDAAVAELQRRWQEVLGPFGGARRITRTTAELRAAVAERFAAPDAGWPAARHQCPDVMLAAESPEAVERGEYQLVLGELHAGANTLRNLLFVDQHPQPDELTAAVAADIPEARVVPVLPKYWLYSTRFLPQLASGKDHRLLLSDESSWFTADERVLPVASLVVERTAEGAVVARDVDRGTVFDMVELLAEALSFKVVSRFQPMAPLAHTPRISIDRLVVSRETWRFHAAELPFGDTEDELEQFTAVRRWARDHGMPRFVFVKAVHETKPFYVDFESPAFTKAFAHAVRAAPAPAPGARPAFAVSEMLPTAEHTWLADHQGNRFTSEFRIVAVDSQRREPPKCQ
ncbi:lantibiotic dehydratase [Streptomyces tirandamycinicus]|uniref:lantibiotic dehydratase n=1 Tax=Streptomyces tirandamycinicus TaxID=2174846 RepID=UPI0034382C0A